MKLNVRVEKSDELYAYRVVVNGRVELDNETFTVCNRVRNALLHDDEDPTSEIAEVAEAIRKRTK